MSLTSVAILAGGIATRLRPITEKIPKALVDINGEPFIAHQLRLLHSQGIRRVVICAWYRGELIQEFVQDGSRFGLSVEYSFDGSTPLGTGGAIKNALPLLEDPFFVLYGDSYLTCDYSAVQDYFINCSKASLMTLFHNLGQWDTSNVAFSNGQILAYEKKNRTPAMQHIDYGLGMFYKRLWDAYPSSQSFDLAEVYKDALLHGQLAGYEVPDRFYEIGSFAGLEELRRLLSASDLK